KKMSFIGVFKGNIYNKNELFKIFDLESKASSLNNVQVIMYLYNKAGIDFIRYINGQFVFALYDKPRGRMIVANDRYGYFPIFYFFNKKKFIFASEAKTILTDSSISSKLEESAIPEFFSFSHLLGDKTFFKQIKYLQPGTVMIYNILKNNLIMHKYFDFEPNKERIPDLEDLLNSFKLIMKNAVERTMQGKKKVGVFLSGGLDSRLIAAFASETSAEVITFTFGAKNCPDQHIAKRVSNKLGLKNIFFGIPSDFIKNFATKIVYNGDGLIRIRDCHFIAHLDMVRKIVDTVLMGTLGGNLFGHNITPLLRKKKINYHTLSGIKKYILAYSNRGLALDSYAEAYNNKFYQKAKEEIQRNFDKEFSQIAKNKWIDKKIDLIDYWDYRVWQPRWIFQAFQYIGWYVETRHPFLDNELVDFFAFKLPIQMRLGERFLEKAMNYCFPKLSSISLEKGSPPDSPQVNFYLKRAQKFTQRKINELLERISRGKLDIRAINYRDYGRWLRGNSKDYVLDILDINRAINIKYFKKDFIKKVLKEHMSAKKNHDQLICDFINFELMNRMFFNKNI
ncbi:MAG: asparagine synthetase B family protein, partial [Candidatus Helarchaeota archaeon]